MPKKTKKQKILAQARRIIQQSELQSQFSPKPQEKDNSKVFQAPVLKYSAPTVQLSNNKISSDTGIIDNNLIPIRNDIIKTVFFAAIALVIELVFYFRFNH